MVRPARTLTSRLARLRVPLGFVFGAAVLVLASPTPRSLAVGIPIAAAGEALRIWAAGHLHKSSEVTASGPYRWLAHPLYAGSSIMGLGLGVASASPLVIVMVGVYLAVTITAAIRQEEAFLRGRFGDRYDRYRDGETVRRQFSIARALANHEQRAVLGFAVAVLLLVLKATYNGAFWRAAGT